jgi:hypothetical protein
MSFLSLCFPLSIIYFLLKPLSTYLGDPKELRKYPVLSTFSGITDVVYMWDASKGFRSRTIYEAHKKHSIFRIGRNSLSVVDLGAIEDLYGDCTSVIKDDYHVVQAGTYYLLANFIGGEVHA